MICIHVYVKCMVDMTIPRVHFETSGGKEDYTYILPVFGQRDWTNYQDPGAPPT